jgi:hypothetical protein
MMAKVVQIQDYNRNNPTPVYFTKKELYQLLAHYSRHVINGEWKDYAIDHDKRMSAFSIYRDNRSQPVFTIFKYAKGTHRHGDYLISTGGNMLKRGKNLSEVLSVLERKLRLVAR